MVLLVFFVVHKVSSELYVLDVKMIKKIMCLTLASSLFACTEPPKSPMEKHARLAAGSELAANRCAGFAGGYAGAVQLKKDANKNIATARSLGATDAVINKARTDVNTAFSTAEVFTSRAEACNQLVGSIAWNTN